MGQHKTCRLIVEKAQQRAHRSAMLTVHMKVSGESTQVRPGRAINGCREPGVERRDVLALDGGGVVWWWCGDGGGWGCR